MNVFAQKTLCIVVMQLIDSIASFFVGFSPQNHTSMGFAYEHSQRWNNIDPSALEPVLVETLATLYARIVRILVLIF